jgi:hypothetical protein
MATIQMTSMKGVGTLLARIVEWCLKSRGLRRDE